MATDLTIQDHHILQFSRNVELLLQQRASRLAGTTAAMNAVGQGAQAVLQFGEAEMRAFSPGTAAGQWKGDTVWDDIEHHQRWVFPSDYSLAIPISKPDPLRMLADPRSSYAEAMRAAYARTVDDTIINAATGDARTGKFDDLQVTAFDTNQIIADSGTGLTIDKLIEAREMLIAADNDPSEQRFFVCSERQLSNLLNTDQIQSADYNSIRALVRGEIDTFLGFQFVSTERLLMTPGTPNVRHCLAYVKSALTFCTWKGLEHRADPRPDKNYVWQLWQMATIGATRTQEKKIVQVNCAE